MAWDVYELAPHQFPRAAHLYAAATFDRAYIDGAFEGVVPARLFVDDPLQPSAALLCRTFEYYVAGATTAAGLRRFMADAPEEPLVFQDFYGFVPLSEAWRMALVDDGRGTLAVIERRELKFTHRSLPGQLSTDFHLPDNARVARLDRRLAEEVDQHLQQFIGAFWNGYERFLERGFGFALLLGERPVSVAYTAGVGGGQANIDVYTDGGFRRRGFSALTSAAYIEHCLRHDLLPTWDSDALNLPSLSLAHRLGFREYPSFCQISVTGYRPLPLSSGRWQRVPGADCAAHWQSQ